MTYTRWTLAMLLDQGPQSPNSLAGITGWPLRRCQRLLDYLRSLGLVRPVGHEGRARRWAAVDRPGLLAR